MIRNLPFPIGGQGAERFFITMNQCKKYLKSRVPEPIKDSLKSISRKEETCLLPNKVKSGLIATDII
jgi:hypothetical protein